MLLGLTLEALWVQPEEMLEAHCLGEGSMIRLLEILFTHPMEISKGRILWVYHFETFLDWDPLKTPVA